MKRYLLGALGMLFLGTAGLLLLHEFVQFPSPAKAQPAGGPPVGIPGVPVPAGLPPTPAQAGQYKELVPALLDSLADPDGEVRQLAAATLVKIGPDAVPPLIAALKGKDRDTRANAAYVLGRLGESAPEALPALAKALKDEDKEVRRRAAFALHSIVSRSQGAEGGMPAGMSMSAAGGPPGSMAGMPGSSMRPYTEMGPMMPGAPAALDPGLLVPAAPKPPMQGPPAKMEKEHK